MTPEELEGRNLGQKHKNYNILVRKAIEADEIQLDHFNVDDPDIHNLLKIDVASSKRNVDYLIKILVCEDLLYVSRVIKKCKWLITEDKYCHIINPQYLHSTLLIKMCTKAANKFMKHIKIHLKNEKRVEQFYEYETIPTEAMKWLPNCSLEFIKNKITRHIDDLQMSELRRISVRSISLLEVYLNNCDSHNSHLKVTALKHTTSLLHTDTNKYLELYSKHILHNNRHNYIGWVKFNATETKLIMKNNADLIINNYMHFNQCIHMPTFVKFLKNDNIEEFLLNLSKKEPNPRYYIKDLHLFLEAMKEYQRFEFVRKVFIDIIFNDDSTTTVLTDTEKSALKSIYDSVPTDFWYKYAPFETAFKYITKNIESSNDLNLKKVMFTTLIISAKKNEKHIHRLLEYFNKQSQNTPFDIKCHFVRKFIEEIKFHKLENITWELLEKNILKSDFSDSEESQMLMSTVAVYKIIHLQIVPTEIEQHLKFNSFKIFKNKLSNEEKDLIFTYLFHFITTKNEEINDKDDLLSKRIKLLHDTFKLLADWDKDLKEYPLLLNEVKNIIKLVGSNSINDLHLLYDTKKSWRKYMFEESLLLKLHKCTLINAIKHDSSMIKRYSKDTDSNRLTNVSNLSQFLKKIKIYFPLSLAVDLRFSFMNDIHNTTNHINVTRGLLELYTREEFINVLEKYAPKAAKIIDMETDTDTISLQKHFAKIMHLSRPQPPPDVILSYAKGDYLKYALPSLLSIFINLNKIKSRIHIPKLLDSQVSLQKHGIRLAFKKLESHELTEIFSTMWKTNKNYSIRSVIFKNVYELLCEEIDSSRKEDIWKLLNIIIDNLTLQEERNVYDILLEIHKIPIEFRSRFFLTVYPFLENVVNSDIEYYNSDTLMTFISNARALVDELPPEFVTKVLLDHINQKFNENKNIDLDHSIIPLISAYLLCSTSINTQMKKHDVIFIPFFKHILSYRSNLEDGKLRMRNYLQNLLDFLCQDTSYFSLKNNHIMPTELFLTIQKELKDSFPVQENYIMLTKWKLTVAFIKAIEEQKVISWNNACIEVAEQFGIICNSYLKKDCNTYFTYIYTLFAEALGNIIDKLVEEGETRYKIYKSMLFNEDFIEAYLVVSKLLLPFSLDESVKQKFDELRYIISKHPSLEVRIHHNYRERCCV